MLTPESYEAVKRPSPFQPRPEAIIFRIPKLRRHQMQNDFHPFAMAGLRLLGDRLKSPAGGGLVIRTSPTMQAARRISSSGHSSRTTPSAR